MNEMYLKLSDDSNSSQEIVTESYAILSGILARNQLFETISAENLSFSLKQNISGDNEEYVPYDERLETYIVPIIFSIIFIVGFLGNGTLVHIFIRHKSMRNLPNTFILCLAIGDLLVLIGTVPFISVIYTLDSWPFGQFICKFSEFLRDVSVGVTVLTLSVLSCDRYLAIAVPFNRTKDNGSKRVTFTIVGLLWTASLICAVPGAYNSQVIEYNISDSIVINVCYPFPQNFGQWYPKMVVSLKFSFYYLIPLLTIGSFYALMARRLVQSNEQVAALGINHNKHIELRTRVAKMVFTLSLIFAVCFLPNHIFMLWFYFTFPNSMENYNMFWHIFKISGYCLTFMNSCLNPVTLYLISGKFRSHFKRYLFGCFSKRPAGLVRTHTFKEGRSKPFIYYSTSIKSSSMVKHYSTNSTRL